MSDLASPLLPDQYTALEEELARLSASIDDIDPAVIETIWDAWRCPSPLLPWLGYALSVDVWDDAWPETVQRQAIADSPVYHRRKGTRRAVEMMLDLARKPYTLTEWFDQVPRGRRGTSHVHIEAEIDEVAAIVARVKPLVYAAKPKSRAIAFGVGPVSRGVIGVATCMLIEDEVIAPPYACSDETRFGAMAIATVMLIEEEIIVRPA